MITNLFLNSILGALKNRKRYYISKRKFKRNRNYYKGNRKFRKNKYYRKKRYYKKNKYLLNKIPFRRNLIFKNSISFLFRYIIILRMFKFLINSTLEKRKPTMYSLYCYNFLIIFSKIKKVHRSLNLLNLMNTAMRDLKRTKGRFFISLIPLLRALRYFYNHKMIQGYKLICKGRFSRRQRSNKRTFQEGSISFGNIASKTDYIFKDVVLKNSLCGFKLYVTYF